MDSKGPLPSMPAMPCGVCSRSFGEESALQQHQRALGHCYCFECEHGFESELDYEQHNTTTHGISCTMASCPADSCTEQFSSQNTLMIHQRTLGHCYCSKCNRTFSAEADLSQHLLASPTHQDKKTVYQCTSCSTTFESKSALTVHLASPIHSTQDPVRCPVCEKSFNRHSAMIQHLGDGTCELSRSERRRAYAAQQALQSGAPPVKIVCAQAASTMASSSTPSFTPSSDPAPVIKKASVIKKRSIIVLEQLAKARAQLELEALSKSFARLSTSSGISEGGAYEIDTVNKTTGAVGAVGVPVQAAHVVDVPVQAAPMEDTSRLPMTKGGSSRPPTIITEKPTTPNLSSAESDTRISGSPVFAQASSSSKTQKSSYPGPTAKISIILPSVRKPNAANKAMTVKASLKWVARLPPKYEARLFVL